MNRNMIIIVLLLVLCLNVEGKTNKKVEKTKAPVCLTLQTENGSVKQKMNDDGSITCILKSSELIRVSSIRLNGEDISNLLENNKLNLPLLSKDSTLEIVFEELPYFTEPVYNTIAMF